MSALAISAARLAPKNQIGSLSVIQYRTSQYSTDVDRLNLAAWKRGTGGRSSFNGIVATVFGASGFVGNYVCHRFARQGAQLILPYRCDHYDMMKLKLAGDLGQILYHPFELRDEKSVQNAVKYSNVVINLIGRDYETKNYKYNDVHVTGARAIARACKQAGVERLIHVSYLNSAEDPEPLVMKKPSGYKKSKWLGEQVIREEFPDATIIKASDIYGSEDRFLVKFAHVWRRQGHGMPLWKAGTATEKQPVYVGDIAQAILNAAKDPDTKGLTYQGVGPKRYRLDHLVDWFFTLMQKGKVWGYLRYDMKYDPFFLMKIYLTEALSHAYPVGNVHWEGIEMEATSDVVLKGIPTLEDLGIKLTEMENQVPWELHPFRSFAYYQDEFGDFEKPVNPPVLPIVYK